MGFIPEFKDALSLEISWGNRLKEKKHNIII